jgi:hypothetical protein
MDRRTEPPIWPQAAARSCGAREELASGIERRALYATQIRKANHGALTNPLFRCVIVSVPAFCHWSERSPLGQVVATFKGGLHHAEDSDRSGCILCDAERCRCCRSASQRAAASGSRSGWQVSGRQVSDWQISTSRARRDQGLTVCVLDARKIERPGYASHYHRNAPLRRGISTLTGIAMWSWRASHAVYGAFDPPVNDCVTRLWLRRRSRPPSRGLSCARPGSSCQNF